MIIYGNIYDKNNDCKDIKAFAYDGKRLQLHDDVYELLEFDTPFNYNAVEITPFAFDRLLWNFGYGLEYVDLVYQGNDIIPAREYLKENYPITYKWINDNFSLYECLPTIEQFDYQNILDTFNCFQAYLNPEDNTGNEWFYLNELEHNVAIKLEYKLSENYDNYSVEALMNSMDYIEDCLKANWYNPEFRLLEDWNLVTIDQLMDDCILEELSEKYEPEKVKIERQERIKEMIKNSEKI